jgi:lactate dehydrogenase-like 2-hydroxyacid dehydrogenase
MAGIKVSNTPGVVAGATADVGIFLLLGALRNFNRGILELRKGLLIVLGAEV